MYLTGNPIGPDGSNDPRDLSDNAQIIDVIATDTSKMETPSRLGDPLTTVAGMKQLVIDYLSGQGFESVHLQYVDGQPLTVIRPTQLIDRGNSVYRVKMPSTFPVTLSGNWAADSQLLIDVGDEALRATLASLSGSGIVGHDQQALEYPQDTVGAELLRQAENSDKVPNIESDIESLQKTSFAPASGAALIDLHYGALLGAGWTTADPPWSASDPQNLVDTVTTSAANVGSNSLSVASVARLAASMMIAVVGADGEYYPNRIDSITGNTIRLGISLPIGVALGARVSNFYRDDAHPNYRGGAAIADYALRILRNYRIPEHEFQSLAPDLWVAVGDASIAPNQSNEYSNPGTISVPGAGALVSGTNPNGGAQSRWVSLMGGDYCARVPVNVGFRTGGFSGLVTVYVDISTPDGLVQTVATSGDFTVGYGTSRLFELNFSAPANSRFRLRVITANGGGWSFSLGRLIVDRLGDFMPDVNRGRHVLLGDSWFVSGSGVERRISERLDQAEVISRGIVGNRASQLIERFDSDVAPLAPNFVWVMVGTNDYYAGVTPKAFEQQILQLKRMISGIGAQAIFFNASVGAVTYSPEQLSTSRAYAQQVDYLGSSEQPDGLMRGSRSANFFGTVTLAAGATLTIAVCPQRSRNTAALRNLLLSSSGLEVYLDYAADISGNSPIDRLTLSGSTEYQGEAAPRISGNSDLRYIFLRLRNPTASSITTLYSADVCWLR